MKTIAIGSKNPVKIAAVRNVALRIWKDVEIVALDVPSGISHQPSSDDEAIQGALNRAKQSLDRTGADLGIGIEGCVVRTNYGTFLSGWAAAISNRGEIGIGSGARLLLPRRIASEIATGKELGPVVDGLVGERNVKQDRGAIGVFTNDLMTRTTATEQSIICALARFLNPQYYESL